MAASSPQLPSDMILEILTRTTLRTLDTCKCVSKEWKQQIEDDLNFMPLHDHRNTDTITSGFFIQHLYHCVRYSAYVPLINQSNNISPYLGSLPHNTKILASSKGILCCEIPHRNSNNRYYVHKPTTGQWRALPNPRYRDWAPLVAMVVLGSNPLRFKIVRLTKTRFAESRCQILDSSSFKWREIQPLTLSYCNLIFSEESVLCKGSFHWQTTEGNIVSFHEPTETFHRFPLPKQVLTDAHYLYQYKKLVEFQGRLGLTRVMEKGKTVELWVVEGDPNQNEEVEWRKHMSIDIGMLKNKFGYTRPVCFSNDGTVLMDACCGAVVHYRIQDSTFDVFKLDRGITTINSIFPFRSDLETVCFR